jgi:hypothetical protein
MPQPAHLPEMTDEQSAVADVIKEFTKGRGCRDTAPTFALLDLDRCLAPASLACSQPALAVHTAL